MSSAQQKQKILDMLDWDKIDWEQYSDVCDRAANYLENTKADDFLLTTTDFPTVQIVDSHYLFVYNEFKYNFRKASVLCDYEPIAVGYTKAHFNMSLFVQGEARFPVAFLDPDAPDKRCPVYGEIYKVSPETIRDIDWLMYNNTMTHRRKIPVDAIVDSNGKQHQLYSYVYLHSPNYWVPRRKHLKSIAPLKSNKGGKPYYSYMKLFDNFVAKE